jgi:8-oxo-dGTP diphosphatase
MGKLQVVTALILDSKGRCLMEKRPEVGQCPSMWAWPGGKVEFGESLESAMSREVLEELGVRYTIGTPLASVHVPFGRDQVWEIFAVPARCDSRHTPRPLACQALQYVDLEYAMAWLPLAPSTYLLYPDVRVWLDGLILDRV